MPCQFSNNVLWTQSSRLVDEPRATCPLAGHHLGLNIMATSLWTPNRSAGSG